MMPDEAILIATPAPDKGKAARNTNRAASTTDAVEDMFPTADRKRASA